jgi:two-component system chemotaxis sensor kinase CheA
MSSQELGKDIDLIINGAETELDKTVVEKIGDPLMHLVRNAMDHGIKRRRPACGGQADQRPPEPECVPRLGQHRPRNRRRRRRAQPRTHPGQSPGDAAGGQRRDAHRPGDLQPDLRAGFSTAEAVTNLSGRGVGMDVVKRNITLLRGTVDLDSRSGEGTVVRIRLPLTLAIINGFLVGIDHCTYVIPWTWSRNASSWTNASVSPAANRVTWTCAARCCRWWTCAITSATKARRPSPECGGGALRRAQGRAGGG